MAPSQTRIAVQPTAMIFDVFSHSQACRLLRLAGSPRKSMGLVIGIFLLPLLMSPVPAGF
jgi:hypothetical protein